MITLGAYLTGLNQVVATTEWKSVLLGVGSKPADNIFVVRRSLEFHLN
jgi:hypothetical protein